MFFQVRISRVLRFISICGPFTGSSSYIGKNKRRKAIPVTGSGGLCDCETSRLPPFLDNRLIDGGELVSLTRRLPFTHRKIPDANFC
jgi:hypothetical protein